MLTPDVALALGLPHHVLLVVDRSEHPVAAPTQRQHGQQCGCGQLHGIVAQVQRLQRVRHRQEDSVSPGEVEAEVVVRDVDGAQVPALVVEEVQDVRGLQQEHCDERVGHEAELLVLLGHERQNDNRPTQDARPAVEKQLEVEPARSRTPIRQRRCRASSE